MADAVRLAGLAGQGNAGAIILEGCKWITRTVFAGMVYDGVKWVARYITGQAYACDTPGNNTSIGGTGPQHHQRSGI